MKLGSKELNSDLGHEFVPKTIADFLREVSVIEDGKKLAKLGEYVFVMEQEMKKINVFKRELPVCMLLLGDAIDRLKEEVVRCKGGKGKAVMMEKFISSGANSDEGAEKSGDINEKKNWMSSAQLWTSKVELDGNFDRVKIQDSSLLNHKPRIQEGANGMGQKTQLQSWNVKNRGGAFVPFKKGCGEDDDLSGDGLSLSPPVVVRGKHGYGSRFSAISEASPREQHQHQREEPPQQPQSKKQRRSWSSDLHRRFVNALEQLGGAQEATPKQIRELMQVADLTNDEVKSHLQKYRLHVRKMAKASSGALLDLNLDGLGKKGISSKKFKMVQSGSPQGPLHLGGSSKGICVSLTIGESLEDEDDEKSESHSWKGGARSG